VRVRVDGARCQGHNRCQLLAPELFDVDEQGFAHERAGGVVKDGLEDRARRAAANCPEGAIAIDEEA
jgi:ferredoxin